MTEFTKMEILFELSKKNTASENRDRPTVEFILIMLFYASVLQEYSTLTGGRAGGLRCDGGS